MEVYPFHHKNLFFNVITDYDLRFTEIRNILDQLLEKEAFHEEGNAGDCGNLYILRAEDIEYEVDVKGYEVVVYRRTDLKA